MMGTQGERGGRTRRRLSTEERREQLLSVGARLFSESPYDEVWIEQVAEIAGVSRGLLYHYFPTKRDFFAAVVERESERMLRLTAAVPGTPVREQLSAGLDTFLAYVEAHAHGFRAFHRADAAGDQAVRRVYQRALAAQEQQILAALDADPDVPGGIEDRPELRIAVRGWLAFTTAVCLEWLRGAELTREQLRDLCARALLGAIAP
ncbi:MULTISPECIES: TetR/AcrR family transcriptional regulator [Streptomyces]|uniref:TetR/AcrR family transcriptional regulator n=1 Tax=Streptomyces mirabilis TaxID=68239 RepID=A0ABU3UDU4_9ACTN|nr:MULTISPECIES: TetR/AcrR family transcriptional regulator [Streptomyces]KPI08218.1 transcriptional regulator, TetR family [Actinobacteria bacterium OK006]MCX4614208.1 TetR/AcrR family transcriptional regulator [Streptomyces mirabilis]MCX5354335.1 TetR/AcrR family transcriptional regulator [Streptomyces mirabilis]MDU8992085.1 TetR/AcrR family transcriptional regulator [Streptomyces mirabilis]NMI63020.1 TetR/AcrR family transcriptional regulator [Streptomyces sp. RLA2-12]